MNLSEIRNRKIDAERRQDNKQHAAKIDQGLKSLDASTSPIRAIWELFQNARDLSDNCQIKVTLAENEFIFEHNGKPFDIDSLSSLIKQVSSQSKESETTIGQYGTGFLTTHYFGMKFRLYGSYQIDENKYVELNGFTIDRSHNNIEELIIKISQQIKATDDLIDNAESCGLIKSAPSMWTKFVYELPIAHKEKAKETIKEGERLVPLVMLFNPQITSCSFEDKTEGRKTEFQRLESDNTDGPLKKATIRIVEEKSENTFSHNEDLYYLQSVDKSDTIVIPLTTESKVKKFIGFPKLFMHFPLIGSEKWGCEFIYNSSRFKPTEKRDSLYLPDGNDNNALDAEVNTSVLLSMDKMLFEFLTEYITKIDDVINIAPIDFDATNCETPQKRDFFANKKREWSEFFATLPLVTTSKGRVAVQDNTLRLSIYDDEIVKFLSEADNEKYSDVIYQYASCIPDCLLPIKEECVQWSGIINNWEETIKPHKISLVDIVGAITSNSDSLFEFLTFLKEIGKSSYFNNYPIIPNREGRLLLAQNLRDARTIPNELYELIKNLIPQETQYFVKEEFSNIIEFPVYNRQNLRKDLSARMQEWRQHISTNAVISSELSQNDLCALISYCSSFPSDADSIRRRLIPSLCKLHNINLVEKVIPNESSEDVDIYEHSFALLVEYSLFVLQNGNVVSSQNLALFDTIISEVSKSETYKGLLEKYAVFPNEECKLCIPAKLKRNNIEEIRKADIYRWAEVVLHTNLKAEFVQQSFSTYFSFDMIDTKGICSEIQSKLLEEDENIGNYKTTILEIIEKIDEANGYDELFKDVNKHKEELFFRCAVSGDKKKDVYTLMKHDETTLSNLAELSKNPNFITIIQRAKKLLEQELQDKIDLAYKKALGKYVESQLRKKLNSSLIDCKIDDVQGGQDIVISRNGKPIYFIEVKSRWSADQSIRMSTTQHIKSVENANNYALCAVDMMGFSQEQAVVGEELTSSQVEVFINRIKCLTNIGILNKSLLVAVQESAERVHIASGYSVLVPQELIKKGIALNDLIEEISTKITYVAQCN